MEETVDVDDIDKDDFTYREGQIRRCQIGGRRCDGKDLHEIEFALFPLPLALQD